MGLGQHDDRRGIVEHEVQALERIGGIHRDIGAAGLEDGEQADHHVKAALHADGDALVGLDAVLAQVVGELVGATIQLRVAEFAILEEQGDCLRRARNLLFEELMHAAVVRERLRGIVPVVQQLPFVGRQYLQVGQRERGRPFECADEAGKSRLHERTDPCRIDCSFDLRNEAKACAQIIHGEGQRIIAALIGPDSMHAGTVAGALRAPDERYDDN